MYFYVTWTTYYLQSLELQQEVVKEIHSLVARRPAVACNFLEGSKLLGGADTRIIYRNYATLYFVFVVDSSESELGILDLIQVFVEALDRCFENVCELDIIFHFEEAHYILDEIISGGLVLETNLAEILRAIQEQSRLVKSHGGQGSQALSENSTGWM
ncbi:Sigma-adaptin 3A [Dispira simplex]|nr:Sigma-adaptin 3A [Dispira simplex]